MLGFFSAFFKTAWGAIAGPAPLARQATGGGTVGGSLGFLLVCSALATIPTVLFYGVIGSALFAFSDLGKEPALKNGGGFIAAAFVMYLVGTPLFFFAFSLIQAAIDHLVLRIAGVHSGFAITLRGMALSSGVWLFGLVPMCSIYFVPLWAVVIRLFIYRELHQTTNAKAAFGALTSTAVCFLGCGGSYAAMVLSALAHQQS